jgi:capsular polysaccharide biosynthesis protein
VSSLNITNKDYCYACSIQQFQRADILIGFHGAGLSNMMFMPKNAIIFEVIDTFNDVNLPLCGYYHNLARIFEHHYYYFGYHRKLNENLPVRSLIQKMKEFYELVHSPSQSAGLQDPRKD